MVETQMNRLVIAIDGPAGAGKSTVAQIVAQKLNYNYIDTGAMYRAVAWKVLESRQKKITEAQIVQVVKSIHIDLNYIDGKIIVSADGMDITKEIRTPEVTAIVSRVAQSGEVRTRLLGMQQKMAESGAVVMDGRDICTHVLPDADVKIFLTASIEERALRRWKELKQKGYDIDLEKLKIEIAARDKSDSEREISPLIQAVDAVLLDTTDLSVDEAVEAILILCR